MLKVRCLVAGVLLGLILAGPAPAQMLVGGGASGGASGSPLKSLLQSQASNSWKTLTAGADPFSAALLPRTKANFDGNGSTWVSDVSTPNPGSPPMGGIGAAAIPQVWTFSGAAISPDTLRVTYGPGAGHADGGDGSVWDLDPTQSNGNDLTWTLRMPGARFIDAFTGGFPGSRPSSGTSPAGAIQTAPSTPGGTNQSYWVMKNKDGNVIPGPGHSYYFNQYIPSTHKMITTHIGGFDGAGGVNSSMNASYVYDDLVHTFAGPFTDTGITGFGQQQGYSPNDSNWTSYGINDLDGTIWLLVKTGSQKICQWTNPLGASEALVNTGVALPGSTWNGTEWGAIAIMPDPLNPARRAMFQHFIALSDTKFSINTGINGTNYSSLIAQGDLTYGSGAVTTLKDANGHPHLTYAWDTNRSLLWMWDGLDIYQITPSATLSAWSIVKITATGDLWANPVTAYGTAFIPTLQYQRDCDCLIGVDQAIVKVFKPPGWSPLSLNVPANDNWHLAAVA